VSRAEREFGFKAKTNFGGGLRKTIDWYEENRNKIVGIHSPFLSQGI
jgi:dTDP-D-glucose 4,6-dehydratase